MKQMKNIIQITSLTIQIYWTKLQIWCIKQLNKLQDEINFTPEVYDKTKPITN